jgi:ankyrin repeat protein
MEKTQQESKIRKILRRISIRFYKPEPEKSAIIAKSQDELDQALFDAAYNGETMKIEPLLNAGADIEAKSEGGITPLILAARQGHIETCRLLLEKGADINAVDIYSRTALMYAAIWGRIRVCKLLVERGADMSIRESQNHRTACMLTNEIGTKLAAYLSRMERLQNLIGKELVPTFLSAFNPCVAA